MPDPKSKRPTHSRPADTTEAVIAFMTTLDHPFKTEIQMIRKLILGVDASIAEGIKWNAPRSKLYCANGSSMFELLPMSLATE